MGVRKTESRIPSGFDAEDLGQATVSPDSQAALVSYYPTPIVTGRKQVYAVFVLDTTLQSSVASYRWRAGDGMVNTEHGIWEHTPAEEGEIEISVDLLNASSTVLRSLSLPQTVVEPNAELEALIAQDDAVHPAAGDPDTSRAVINDLRAYMDLLAPRDADPSSSLNRTLFAIAYVEMMGQPAEQRDRILEQIAAALDAEDSSAFAEEGSAGIGVCRIRPHVLGMYLPETPGGSDWYLTRREYPAQDDQRLGVHREMLQELAGLPQEKQLDLFNLLRFPKSNLSMAIQLLEGLRAQYSTGDLESLINDKEQIQSLLDQFKQGPYEST